MSYNPPMKEQILHYFRNLYYEDKKEYEKLSSGLDKLVEETKNNQWIPCSEELPKKSGFYHVTIVDLKPYVCTLWFDGSCWYVPEEPTIIEHPIAWMPKPKPMVL